MSKALLIRADANARMGTGHVMRCVALGQAWQDAGGTVVFATCCDNAAILQRLRDENFQVIELNESNDFLSLLTSDLRPLTPECWLVLDGYHFDLEYQRAVRRAGFKLLLVDDYNHLPEYEADILLNQNIGAEEINYQCNSSCRKLLGIRYVMLRREFRTFEKRRRDLQTVGTRVLVTMGGADPDNATLDVLKALSSMPDKNAFDVRVIIGPSNLHKESLEHYSKSTNLSVVLLDSVTDMPSLIQWADFSISAAGSTCWELSVLGVPFITVVLAENQEAVAEKLEKQANMDCAGWSGEGLQERVASLLCKYFDAPQDTANGSNRLQLFVDRFGADRVLSKPAQDCGLDLYQGRLALRKATVDDAHDLFEWANDSVSIGKSFHSEPISWAGHLSWLQAKLNSTDNLFLIASFDGNTIGYVRYDKDGKVLVLSFFMSPYFRGLGLASGAIKLSLEWVESEFGNIVVRAFSFSENLIAHKTMLNAGFVITQKEFCYMERTCSEFELKVNTSGDCDE